jgi:hypothetical protein
MRRSSLAAAPCLLAAALLPGCGRDARDVSPAGGDTAGTAAATASTTAAAEPRPALPFIENDYARALAEARRKQVPLFVELWAPW